MSRSLPDRTLALAGLFQAVSLVDRTAWQGPPGEEEMAPTLESILQIDAADTASVFGGRERIDPGLRLLARVMGGNLEEADTRRTRYALNLLGLAHKARRQPELLASLQSGLERSREQARHFRGFQENVLAGLAELYVNTVGSMQPRIMVSGEEARLHNTRNVNVIRSLLLGGFRAAWLWHQCGGSRWGLLFGRKRYAREAERLLRA